MSHASLEFFLKYEYHGECSPFCLAILNGKASAEDVRRIQDDVGVEALACACCAGSVETVRLLIDERSVVADEHALHVAIRRRHPDIVRLLLDRGARTDVPNCIGFHPLHVACEVRCTDIVRTLVDRGADVNASLDHGKNYWTQIETPLDVAYEHGFEEGFHFLVANGARVSERFANAEPMVASIVRAWIRDRQELSEWTAIPVKLELCDAIVRYATHAVATQDCAVTSRCSDISPRQPR